MKAYAAAFDAALVAPSQLAMVVEQAGHIEKMASTVASLAAARIAGGAGLPIGAKLTDRRAAEMLAKSSGTSLKAAHEDIQAAKAIAGQPEVQAAARDGELSRAQARIVAGAAEANPAAAQRLLEAARSCSLSELVAHAQRARAEAEDLEARRTQFHENRAVRDWTDAYGTWHMGVDGLPDEGAEVMAALQPYIDEIFDQARNEGRHERREAYAYDALLALARAGGPKQRPGYEILVRVDHDALLRGYAVDGETCEVAGFGSVPPKVVHDIIETRDPFLKAVVTKGKDVIGVAHLGRRPNAYQSTALDWLYPSCAVAGCPAKGSYLQSDHRVDWAKTRFTVLDLLDRLCPHHHRLKTNEGWLLVAGKGKRAFVPPDDPRHPRNTGDPPEDLQRLRDALRSAAADDPDCRSTFSQPRLSNHGTRQNNASRQRDVFAPAARQPQHKSTAAAQLFEIDVEP
ncbi:MAG TPA: HNH endonuclease signature motif containing protein [Acidimicrobiales bacterium]|nr:HNH endonuclease signature motif containing protein [Acidimicrobiales bacterium]